PGCQGSSPADCGYFRVISTRFLGAELLREAGSSKCSPRPSPRTTSTLLGTPSATSTSATAAAHFVERAWFSAGVGDVSLYPLISTRRNWCCAHATAAS